MCLLGPFSIPTMLCLYSETALHSCEIHVGEVAGGANTRRLVLSGHSNVSVYVKHKDPNTRILKDVMIYDFSNVSGAGENSASDNISIICADSARLQTTSDKEALLLTLYNGETFENMRQQKPTPISQYHIVGSRSDISRSSSISMEPGRKWMQVLPTINM